MVVAVLVLQRKLFDLSAAVYAVDYRLPQPK
jgi:hypothetical protein